MRHFLLFFYILLAISAAVGGVEYALSINTNPGPWPENVPHAPVINSIHTPEILQVPSMSPSPTRS